MSPAILQNDLSVESFFNVVETETLALFEHLSFKFLEEFDVFAPAMRPRPRPCTNRCVFVALCLRLVVAITNYERGNEPSCEKL